MNFERYFNPKKMAQAVAHRIHESRKRVGAKSRIDWTLPVLDLVPVLFPGYVRPSHMCRYGTVLDDAIAKWSRKEPTSKLVVVAAPPQHGKTETFKVALAKGLKLGHGMRHMYVTYNQTRCDKVAKDTRRWLEELGFKIEGGIASWYFPETKSTVVWTSIGGVGSGEPVTGFLEIDDPFKGFAEARSAAFREEARAWTVGVGLRRIHTTTTVIEMATRWHEADLSNWFIETMGVPYVNIQGICEDPTDGTGREVGEPLFPALHPIEMLEMQRRAQPQEFEAQYQGRPRAMGDSLFDEPKRFIEFPEHHSFVTAYGIDLAYSESTISDWSVILRGRRIGNDLYVIGCERKQIAATKFLPLMKRMYDQVHGVVRWYHGGGGELGMVSFIAREIQNFCGIAAKNDKVIRSANAQKAWNTGHVHLPSEESPFYGQWVKDMRSEVVTFSGAGDEHDDFVDALAALVDQMFGTSFDWDTADGMQDSITRAKARNTVNAGGWRRT